MRYNSTHAIVDKNQSRFDSKAPSYQDSKSAEIWIIVVLLMISLKITENGIQKYNDGILCLTTFRDFDIFEFSHRSETGYRIAKHVSE